MSLYVCSDLHGNLVEFLELLKLIDFKSIDELYIIGDIFDRGPAPLGIYEYIKDKENIHLIIGNHEQFFIDLYKSILSGEYDDFCYKCWMINGGDTTLKGILKEGKLYASEIYRYLKKCSYKHVVNDFVLVHAGINLDNKYKDKTLSEILDDQDEETLLWDRRFIENDKYIEGVTVIVGHTPTLCLNNGEPKIVYKKGKIIIDCGLVYGGKLACLRIDDMKEFYIDSK